MMTNEETHQTHFSFGRNKSIYTTTSTMSYHPFGTISIKRHKAEEKSNIPFQSVVPEYTESEPKTISLHKFQMDAYRVSSEKVKDMKCMATLFLMPHTNSCTFPVRNKFRKPRDRV